MLRRTSPAETYKYVDGVVQKFKDYVENDILPKLCSQTLTYPQIATGLQYIPTRKLLEYEHDVLELLTLHFTGHDVLPIYERALRTADWYDINSARLTRTLASAMINQTHQQRDQLYERKLIELAKPAGLSLLDMIQPHQKLAAKRRLVNLTRKTTHTKSPEPLKAWTAADGDELRVLKARWESLIDPDGLVRKALQQAANIPQTQPSAAPGEPTSEPEEKP